MSDNWIKIRNKLPNEPEVAIIAAGTGLDEDHVVGKLVRLWAWADEHVAFCDGDSATKVTQQRNPGITTAWVDRFLRCPGFAENLIAAGWLGEKNGAVFFPNIERHITSSAKTRAQGAKRAQVFRGKTAKSGSLQRNAPVTQQRYDRNAGSVTGALPEKEKEKEKEKEVSKEPNPPTPQGGHVDFFDGLDLTEAPPPKPPKPKKPPKPPRPKPPDYEPATATLPAQLDGPGFRAAWVDWFEYRTASRFPKWVEKTIEAQLKQFTEWGPEAAISAIAKSIANGWKGIFEPEQRQAPRQQQKAPPTSDERMRVIDAQTRAAMGLPPREGNPVLLAVRPPEKISIAFAPAVNTIPESTLRLLRREPLTRGG